MNAQRFGARIRIARERLGLSQEDLAAAVGKDQGSISEYESGKRRLYAIELPLYARILQVPLSYFYENEILPSDIDQVLLEAFRQLPNSDAQQAAIEIILILIKRGSTFFSSD